MHISSKSSNGLFKAQKSCNTLTKIILQNLLKMLTSVVNFTYYLVDHSALTIPELRDFGSTSILFVSHRDTIPPFKNPKRTMYHSLTVTAKLGIFGHKHRTQNLLSDSIFSVYKVQTYAVGFKHHIHPKATHYIS